MHKRTAKLTQDGSSTLFIPEWNEHYHSSHGALQEAQHVFIKNGIEQIGKPQLTIIEYGFGTGLNALLSALYAEKHQFSIKYLGLEKYPVNFDELKQINYQQLITDEEDFFGKIHRIPWGNFYPISSNFRLNKYQEDFHQFQFEEKVDLVFFDAFGYRVQPHLWTEEVFKKIYDNLNSGGLLTTYSSKGLIRRMLQDIGFEVHKLEGPKGKREMMNAWKR